MLFEKKSLHRSERVTVKPNADNQIAGMRAKL